MTPCPDVGDLIARTADERLLCEDCALLVEFDVIGTPKPQGSKSAFNAKNNGRAMMKESGGAEFAAWRNAIAHAAREQAAHVGKLDGPLGLSVEFRFPMPASRPKAVRVAGRAHKTTAPDLSKLIRALEDGLQAGGLIVDDARFCAIEACKVEIVDGWHGAAVRITRAPCPYGLHIPDTLEGIITP